MIKELVGFLIPDFKLIPECYRNDPTEFEMVVKLQKA